MQTIGTLESIVIDYKTKQPKITLNCDKNCLETIESLKDNKLSIEIKKWHKKRSLDANAYCWALCDKIAKKIGATKEEIYKDAISNVGTFEPMIVEERAFENFKRIWEKQGLGFLIQEVSRKDKCIKVHCYYGSSSYNTKEMSILIDFIVQEAKQVGVETMPDKELKSLLEAWK
jgi:hypothetical protein